MEGWEECVQQHGVDRVAAIGVIGEEELVKRKSTKVQTLGAIWLKY